jgi:hypothetical protein
MRKRQYRISKRGRFLKHATTNGTALISNTGANNSQLVKITPLDNGIYSLIVGANQGFERNASNGKMQFYGYWGAINQKMKLEIK